MTVFILIALLITAATLALLVLPLLRSRKTVSFERHAQNIHFAKERLQELEEQLKNATISATDYEALKLEIETTLAHDIDLEEQSRKEPVSEPANSNKFVIALLSLFLPLSGFGFYLLTGTPETFSEQRTENQVSSDQVSQLVDGIEKRLEETPDDLRGWTLLSRTYLSLGRYRDARDAYLRVLALGGEQASTYAALADSTALMANGEITSEAASYIDKALQIDPVNQQALWMAGLGAVQKNDPETAKTYWGKLLPLLSEMPEQQQELKDIMEQTLGGDIGSVVQIQPATESETRPSTQIADGLTVSVILAPEIKEKANQNDFVFVFARAKQGPPMPLAVKRLMVRDLPATVTLSDADAMMEQLKLSAFDEVVVSARLSKSGQPVAQAGDFQSALVDVKSSSNDAISLTITDEIE